MKRTTIAFTFMLVLPGVAVAAEKTYEHGRLGYIIAYLLIMFGFGAAAGNAASKKGYNYIMWFIVGLLLPFIGLVIAWVLPHKHIAGGNREKEEIEQLTAEMSSNISDTKKCPKCGEMVKLDAKTCHYCRNEFSEDEVVAEKQKAKDFLLKTEKEVLNYLCDICSISIPSKSSGTFFDANRVLTSPSYWERLSIKGHSLGKLDEETLAMYLKMKMNKKRDPSGYTVCEKCRDMLKMDRQKAKDYGLDAVCKFPIPYSIPTGHIDMNAVILVVGIIWEKIHGSWPSTIDRALKGK